MLGYIGILIQMNPQTVELERNVALCDLISEQRIWDEGTAF